MQYENYLTVFQTHQTMGHRLNSRSGVSITNEQRNVSTMQKLGAVVTEGVNRMQQNSVLFLGVQLSFCSRCKPFKELDICCRQNPVCYVDINKKQIIFLAHMKADTIAVFRNYIQTRFIQLTSILRDVFFVIPTK